MTMSLMQQEARETAARIRDQLAHNTALCASLAAQIRAFEPAFVYIVGRGTSDHAGVFARYLIEVELGLAVAAAAPSVASLFGRTSGRALQLNRALVLLISQSGRSEDLLLQAQAARDSGALLVALVNDAGSPLARLAHHTLPLLAGPELAVAATKSYLCTLSSLLLLVAQWKQDAALLAALAQLPAQLEDVCRLPGPPDYGLLKNSRHCVVLGRAFGYAIAREMALKIKEICGIQAEAFSSAEFLHGPVSLLNQPLVLLNAAIDDESASAHQRQINEVRRRGGEVLDLALPAQCEPESRPHPRLQPLLLMQRFYLDVEALAQQLGLNPDAPKGLNKVTSTV